MTCAGNARHRSGLSRLVARMPPLTDECKPLVLRENGDALGDLRPGARTRHDIVGSFQLHGAGGRRQPWPRTLMNARFGPKPARPQPCYSTLPLVWLMTASTQAVVWRMGLQKARTAAVTEEEVHHSFLSFSTRSASDPSRLYRSR
jgi:hypothetical protein